MNEYQRTLYSLYKKFYRLNFMLGQYHFLYNLKSGGLTRPGSLARLSAKIHGQFPDAPIASIEPGDHEQLRQLENCLNAGYIPVVVGGDGTLSRTITHLIAIDPSSPILGHLPLGTGNDTPRSLQTSRSLEKAITKLRLNPEPKPLDILEVSESGKIIAHGLTLAAFGLPSQVIKKSQNLHWLGALKYAAGTILSLQNKPQPTPHIDRLEADCPLPSEPARLVGLANGSHTGGGMKMVPSASLYDGKAEFVMLDKTGPLRLLWLLLNVFVGTHITDKHVTITECNRLVATLDNDLDLVVDGELYRVRGTIDIRLRSQAITLLV